MDKNRIDVYLNWENFEIILKHPDFLSVMHYPRNDKIDTFEIGKMKIDQNTYLHFNFKSKEKQQIFLENLMEDVEILLQDNLTKLQEIRKSLK